jgi:hypothetical protein
MIKFVEDFCTWVEVEAVACCFRRLRPEQLKLKQLRLKQLRLKLLKPEFLKLH